MDSLQRLVFVRKLGNFVYFQQSFCPRLSTIFFSLLSPKELLFNTSIRPIYIKGSFLLHTVDKSTEMVNKHGILFSSQFI